MLLALQVVVSGVLKLFGNKATDSHEAEVVEEGADFFCRLVDAVAVLVEEGEK
jgi:hypothetical protein